MTICGWCKLLPVLKVLLFDYIYNIVAVIQGKKGQFGDMMEEEDNCPSSATLEGIGDLGQLIFKFEVR